MDALVKTQHCLEVEPAVERVDTSERFTDTQAARIPLGSDAPAGVTRIRKGYQSLNPQQGRL